MSFTLTAMFSKIKSYFKLGIYKTGDNPIFEAFTVSGKATLADLSGEPAKTYEL